MSHTVSLKAIDNNWLSEPIKVFGLNLVMSNNDLGGIIRNEKILKYYNQRHQLTSSVSAQDPNSKTYTSLFLSIR